MSICEILQTINNIIEFGFGEHFPNQIVKLHYFIALIQFEKLFDRVLVDKLEYFRVGDFYHRAILVFQLFVYFLDEILGRYFLLGKIHTRVQQKAPY
jgi:hypothetical protein